MAAGAAARVARAQSHHEAGREDFAPARFDAGLQRPAERRRQHRRADQSGQEGQAPRRVAARPLQQSAQDAADAGNAAIEQHQHRRRRADGQSAEQGGAGGEVREIDRHIAESLIN